MGYIISGQAREALKGIHLDFEAGLGAFNLDYRVKAILPIARPSAISYIEIERKPFLDHNPMAGLHIVYLCITFLIIGQKLL